MQIYFKNPHSFLEDNFYIFIIFSTIHQNFFLMITGYFRPHRYDSLYWNFLSVVK